METVVAFDFDGTLTKKDSFIEFIKYSRGTFLFYFTSPVIVFYWFLFKIKLLNRQSAKELVFSFFFKGMGEGEFNEYCSGFSTVINGFLKNNTIDMINDYLKKDFTIIIISASIENWIKPWALNNKVTSVLATQIEIDDKGVITGKFSSKNCIGIEKVNRLLIDYPIRDDYKLIAYGNSNGDLELIKFADKGLWNNIK